MREKRAEEVTIVDREKVSTAELRRVEELSIF